MNKLYAALGYSTWSWHSELLFGIYAGDEYVWTYICQGPMLIASLRRDLGDSQLGFWNVIVHGPCGPIVI